MDLVEFLKTIYLGDRGCKSILIDGWNSEVRIQVTCISRVRSSAWDYYSAEDLPDGYIIFEGVTNCIIEPSGPLPNDSINEIWAEQLAGQSARYAIRISIDSVDDAGNHTEIEIRMDVNSMSLEDSRNPGKRITE